MKNIVKYLILPFILIFLLIFILGLLVVFYCYIRYGTSEIIDYNHRESELFIKDFNMDVKSLQPFFSDDILLTILINENPHNKYNIWVGCKSKSRQHPILIDYIVLENKNNKIRVEYQQNCYMEEYTTIDSITYSIFSGSVVQVIDGEYLFEISEPDKSFTLEVYYKQNNKPKITKFFIEKKTGKVINFPT